MNLLTPFRRPEYFYRPVQILRRLTYPRRLRCPTATVALPWGYEITILTSDRWIGQTILKTGLDDLPVCEVIWRLVERGDTAIDIGSNIGQMVSIMVERAGKAGVVHAIEPHPKTFEMLNKNCARWSAQKDAAHIVLHELAISDSPGLHVLEESVPWEVHSGGVAVRKVDSNSGAVGRVSVKVARIDEILGADRPIGVVKCDVEGGQHEAILSCGRLIENNLIRDIIYEIGHEDKIPDATSLRLANLGYETFIIDKKFDGPRLRKVKRGEPHVVGHMTSVLATIDPERASRICESRGWQCLSAPPLRK